MNPERLKSGAGSQASVRICMRLTRSQLAALDRFCTEEKLTRSQAVRKALKHHLIQRAYRARGVSPQCPRRSLGRMADGTMAAHELALPPVRHT